ncbi:MAG: class I tRNA ligase family protein, partial [Silicimonas sp.]|nr:class I tRNA ligase family protein [Silicimonas sp.]
WMHNEMLQVEGKKMSKSLGNFFTVRDLLDQGIPGEVIRFVFLSTHYRKPMDWTAEKAREAEATLKKWANIASGVNADGDTPERVLNALKDDLNTPLAIKELHDLAAADDATGLDIGARLLGIDLVEFQLSRARQAVERMTAAFDENLEALLAHLIEERRKAKAEKRFEDADSIRDALSDVGITLKDGPDGTSFELGDDFAPARLKDLEIVETLK